jgi:hypothetical protein
VDVGRNVGRVGGRELGKRRHPAFGPTRPQNLADELAFLVLEDEFRSEKAWSGRAARVSAMAEGAVQTVERLATFEDIGRSGRPRRIRLRADTRRQSHGNSQ